MLSSTVPQIPLKVPPRSILPYLEIHIQDAVRFVHDEELEGLEVEAARVLQMVHQTTGCCCN